MSDNTVAQPVAPNDARTPLDPINPATQPTASEGGAAQAAPSPPTSTLVLAPTSRIFVPPEHNRWRGSPGDLRLRASLESTGLLQAIVVFELYDGMVQLACGSRRLGAWMSSAILRDRPIPAFVISRAQALAGTIGENQLREALSGVDRGRIIKLALETSQDHAATAAQLVEHFGLSDQYLRNLQRVFDQPQLWHHVEEQRIPLKSALGLAGLPEEELASFLVETVGSRPKISRNEITKLANVRLGTELQVSLRRTGLRQAAGEVIDLMLEDVEATTTVDMEFDEQARRATVVARVPMPKGGVEAARAKIARVEAAIAAHAAKIEAALDANEPQDGGEAEDAANPDATPVPDGSDVESPVASSGAPVDGSASAPVVGEDASAAQPDAASAPSATDAPSNPTPPAVNG